MSIFVFSLQFDDYSFLYCVVGDCTSKLFCPKTKTSGFMVSFWRQTCWRWRCEV